MIEIQTLAIDQMMAVCPGLSILEFIIYVMATKHVLSRITMTNNVVRNDQILTKMSSINSAITSYLYLIYVFECVSCINQAYVIYEVYVTVISIFRLVCLWLEMTFHTLTCKLS